MTVKSTLYVWGKVSLSSTWQLKKDLKKVLASTAVTYNPRLCSQNCSHECFLFSSWLCFSPVPVALLVCLTIQPGKVNYKTKHGTFQTHLLMIFFQNVNKSWVLIFLTLKVYFVLKNVD